jgi:hypothetical protein
MRQGEPIETLIISTHVAGFENRGRRRRSRSGSTSRTRVTVTYRDRRPSPDQRAHTEPRAPITKLPTAPSPSPKPMRAISYRIVSIPHSEERGPQQSPAWSSPSASRAQPASPPESRVAYLSHHHHRDAPPDTKPRASSPVPTCVQPAPIRVSKYGGYRQYNSLMPLGMPQRPSSPPPRCLLTPARRSLQTEKVKPGRRSPQQGEKNVAMRTTERIHYESPPPPQRRPELVSSREYYAPIQGPRVRFHSEASAPHRPASPEPSPVRHRHVARYHGHDTSETKTSRYFYEDVEEDRGREPRTKPRMLKTQQTFNKFVMGLFPHT